VITVVTEHPLAEWSPDHIHPKGAATDSTRDAGFNRKLFKLVASPRLLDLGCAGGGLVASVIEDGGLAVGIDGSDYNQVRGREEWGRHADTFFTADITRPFTVLEDGRPAVFDVVTAWEVLEHIPEHLLPAVMGNVRRHLAAGGMFICSISQQHDPWDGFDYHVTVHPELWWRGWFAGAGWTVRDDLFSHFDPDWVRGPKRGMDSFNLVLTLEGAA